jgi:hypothetical protein
MRIMSFRVTPIARVLAIIYGVSGFAYVPTLLLFGAKQMTLPIGVVGTVIFLSLNLHFAVPTHFVTGVLSTLGASLCYAATGWMTGVAVVLIFNFVARRLGGIEASVLTRNVPAIESGSARPV